MFYNYFLDEVINKDLDCDPIFKDAQFRRFVIKTKGKNIETIKFLREPLTLSMKKPQQCLYNDKDYYLAIDSYTKTYYVCYRNLMMIDMDFGKDGNFKDKKSYLQFLEEYCNTNKNILLDVYQTRNGVHCFVLDKEHSLNSDESLNLMIGLKCDFYYIIYASIRGWSVRVNRKYGDKKGELYKHLGRIGYGKANPYLEKLVKLHLGFANLFKEGDISKMA